MRKTRHAATLWILATMVLVIFAPVRADNDTPPPAAAPAGEGEGFESDGRAEGAQTPEKVPAESEETEEVASEEEAPPPASPLAKWFPFIMIGGFLVLWMFMGRSRKKREAQRREMIEKLTKGDRVVTIGGIVGTIVETRESELVVKVDDNTRMKFARWAVRNAGDAAAEDKKKDTQEQQ